MSGGIEESYNLLNLRETLTSVRPLLGEQIVDFRSFWDILITARKKFSVIGCNIEVIKSFKKM